MRGGPSAEGVMKASETKLQKIIEGTSQYVVPLFQRTYSWTQKEWGTLWDDLMDLCEEAEPRNHFIGSIVTMPTRSVPEGVAKYLLIDGQQRLTTLFILLAILRDHAKDQGNLAEEIQKTLLTNPYKQGLDTFKLLPTQADRDSFKEIIQGQSDGPVGGQIDKARSYFEKQLRNASNINLEKLKSVIVGNLVLVSIVLDSDDNPHLIFESLNAKGRALSQADLIRNYFFMRIHVDRQESLYGDYWKPMLDELGDSLTECIRHFLMKEGEVVKQGDVYFALKEHADKQLRSENEVVGYLAEVARFAKYYAKLLDPAKEQSIPIRERIARLNRIEVTTAYPFLLSVYDDFVNGRITQDDFAGILDVLENFMIRRWVCSVPTYGLNKVFPPLYAQSKRFGTLLDGVKDVLSGKNYPRDDEFHDRLVNTRLYASGERATKTKLILERLENHALHHEPVSSDKLTVEHVMPQTLTDAWRAHIGDDAETVYEQFLHTLGNLTLTGYNVIMSNNSFAEKQRILADSHVELNKYFEGIKTWDRDAIGARAEHLAIIALLVWPYFGSSGQGPARRDGVTYRKPAAVLFFGQRIPVTTWRDVAQRTLEAMADRDADAFDLIAKQFPRYIAKESGSLRDARRLANGAFVETHLSANDLYRLCVQVTDAASISSEDWQVEFA
jgi:uncharacterized protein with ParB-like and HNH nuclease domain